MTFFFERVKLRCKQTSRCSGWTGHCIFGDCISHLVDIQKRNGEAINAGNLLQDPQHRPEAWRVCWSRGQREASTQSKCQCQFGVWENNWGVGGRGGLKWEGEMRSWRKKRAMEDTGVTQGKKNCGPSKEDVDCVSLVSGCCQCCILLLCRGFTLLL